MKKEDKKKKSTGLYTVGSLALAAGAVIVAPKVIDYLSDKMYKPTSTPTVDDDDWGPEIVKKEKAEGVASAEEGDSDTDGEL